LGSPVRLVDVIASGGVVMANLTKPMFIQVGGRLYPIATFAQASQMFCIARDKSGEGNSSTPSPLIVDDAGEVIVPFYWILYDQQKRRGIEFLRQARKSRGADCSPQRLFKDALAAEKAAAKAAQKLRDKRRTLPDNEQIDCAGVVIGYRENEPVSSAFAGELIRQFDDWIKEAQDNPDRVRYLQQMKISKLEDLAATIKSVLAGQKQSGLWDLRVDAGALKHAAWRLTYEATRLKLRTIDDCLSAANFLQSLAKVVDLNIDDELICHHVVALTRNIAAALTSLEPKGERKGMPIRKPRSGGSR
jgi:hypothetical protein